MADEIVKAQESKSTRKKYVLKKRETVKTDYKVNYENDRINKIQKQIRIFEYKISELRRTIQDYI